MHVDATQEQVVGLQLDRRVGWRRRIGAVAPGGMRDRVEGPVHGGVRPRAPVPRGPGRAWVLVGQEIGLVTGPPEYGPSEKSFGIWALLRTETVPVPSTKTVAGPSSR